MSDPNSMTEPAAASPMDEPARLPLATTVADENRYAKLQRIIEALLLASELPLPVEQLHRLLAADLGVSKVDIRTALAQLAIELEGRAAELQEVASGYRIQVRSEYSEWVSRLWQEKPPKLSRALLETLALICYRQPVTRGEIEEVRGVALSPNIIRTLLERGWVREVGQKEVPGRPSLFGTTAHFLDDFNLRTLDDLPSLPDIKDAEQLEAALIRLGEVGVSETPAIAAPTDEATAEQASAERAETPAAPAAEASADAVSTAPSEATLP